MGRDTAASKVAEAGGAAKAPGRLRFAAIGICCALAWAFLINGAGSAAPTAQFTWQASYVVLSLAMMAFGLVAEKWPQFIESPAAGYAVAGIGVAGSAALVVSFAEPSLALLQMPASIVCSCVLGWLYLQWGGVSTCALGRARPSGACSSATSRRRP